MALKDKAAFLAELHQRVPKKLEERMDGLIARLSDLDKRGDALSYAMSARLDEHEAGVDQVEEAVQAVERMLNTPNPTNGSGRSGHDTVPDSPQHDLIKRT